MDVSMHPRHAILFKTPFENCHYFIIFYDIFPTIPRDYYLELIPQLSNKLPLFICPCLL